MHQIRRRKRGRTNYKVVSDGDLWEHFEKAVRAKGVHAIRITKVKGHVTQEQVDSKQYRAVDKKGNDKADQAADVGTALYGKDVIDTAKNLHGRHYRYTKFMLDVAKHIIEGYLIHRKLTDIREAKEEKADRRITYQPISYPNSDHSAKLEVRGKVQRFSAFCRKHKCATDVHHFHGNLKGSHTSDPYKAITWLELYILYRTRGYTKPIEDNKNKARARATVQMQLDEFKSVIRGISDRLDFGHGNRQILSPANITHERFSTLAISGKHMAIQFQADLEDHEQDRIGDCLITLGHHMSADKIRQFKANRLLLLPKRIILKGRAGWDSKLGIKPRKSCPTQAHFPSSNSHIPICYTPRYKILAAVAAITWKLVDVRLCCIALAVAKSMPVATRLLTLMNSTGNINATNAEPHPASEIGDVLATPNGTGVPYTRTLPCASMAPR